MVEEQHFGEKRPTHGRWSTSAATKRAILDAARERFCIHGYERTSIADIVEQSGVSVGSIYHHVGGKAEIFEVVVKEAHGELARESRRAMAAAQEAGERNPVELYLRGARAYMLHAWRERELNRLLLSDDHPPGFVSKHHEYTERILSGLRGIQLGSPPTRQASDSAIVSLIRAAASQLVVTDDEIAADAMIDYFVDLIRVLAKPSPE